MRKDKLINRLVIRVKIACIMYMCVTIAGAGNLCALTCSADPYFFQLPCCHSNKQVQPEYCFLAKHTRSASYLRLHRTQCKLRLFCFMSLFYSLVVIYFFLPDLRLNAAVYKQQRAVSGTNVQTKVSYL